MDKIVHFEIPADDVKRAIKFYEKNFGWKFKEFSGMNYYSIIAKDQSGDGINGGLMKRPKPGHPFTNYIAVDSIDKSMKNIISSGGKMCMKKTPIGSMGWIAAFTDPEGNMLGLVEPTKEMKEQAKKPKK
jgi:uncharacterized protein